MTTADMRARLRITGTALDAEIEAKVAVANAEMARVGINVANAETKAAALLDYARELFCKAEFNFDGRGELYMARFEGARDAMKLTTACTAAPDGASAGAQEATG